MKYFFAHSPFRLFKKGCGQLQAKVYAQFDKVLINCLVKLAQEKLWLGQLTLST